MGLAGTIGNCAARLGKKTLGVLYRKRNIRKANVCVCLASPSESSVHSVTWIFLPSINPSPYDYPVSSLGLPSGWRNIAPSREHVRSEERRVGKECVRTCRYCGSL